MPIYEYEPVDHDCLICNGRVEFLQGVAEPALEICRTCGLGVRRVVSRASTGTKRGVHADKAAEKGFTTFKRVGKGQWEKTAGHGPDMIVGSAEDIASVESENKPRKVVDLDQ